MKTRPLAHLTLLLLASWPAWLNAESPRAPVELKVLTYNTHGLPAWIARDDPEARFPQISQLINRYRVVLVQENWNFNELLLAQAKHAVVVQGNVAKTATRRAFGLNGSGLTTLADAREADQRVTHSEALGACSGWLGGAMDCWASKGFVHLRLRLENGAEVDFYNTHLDAGDGEDDRAARRTQLQNLSTRALELSNDRAMVVGGDFNLASTVAADRELLEEFRARLGLTNAEQVPDETRRLDYLFFRSGGGVTLELTSAGEAEEFTVDGTPLSDHPAIAASFSVR